MQCSDLELVLEQEGLDPLSEAANQHLAQCNACKRYVEDLNSIVAVAHELPAEVEPPERIWISIRAQLESECVIRAKAKGRATSTAPAWWQSIAELFRHRAFAGAAVAVLIVAAAVSQLQKPQTSVPAQEARDDGFTSTVNVLSQQEHDLANIQLASTGGSSAEASPVDTSLRQNLQQVDEFIADCERRLKEQPSDELAREYLTNAYQQKAELLSVMMDRRGSLN